MKKPLLAGLLLVLANLAFAQSVPELFGVSYLYGGSVFSIRADGTDFGTRKVWSPDAGKPFAGLE
jgi:hypothetical protein